MLIFAQMRKVKQKGLDVLTQTEKNLLDGAAIGIAAALASSKINKPSKNGRVNYKKLGEDAQQIAEAFFGQDVPTVKDAIEGYVESMKDDVCNENTTFADLVSALDEQSKLEVAKMAQEEELAEAQMSEDTVTLRHINKHSDKLIEIICGWQEMEYEHNRRVISIKRPPYQDALAAARKSGIEAGFYAEDGSISKEYIEKIRQQVHAEKAEREVAQKAEQLETGLEKLDDAGSLSEPTQPSPVVLPPTLMETENSSDMMLSEDLASALESYDLDEVDEPEDNFFAQIAEKLEHPLNDMSGLDVMVEDYKTVDEEENEDFYEARTVALPVIGAAAIDVESDVFDDEYEDVLVEGESESDEPEIEIPSEEVLEILEPEPVKDPTEPIVMEASAIAEAIAEEAQGIENGTLTAEVADAMVEEMEEAAELDAEECKSFTDQFMAVEVGPDGHAHPHGEEPIIDEKQDMPDENVASDTQVEEVVVDGADDGRELPKPHPVNPDDLTEEILAISAKTRNNIKNLVDKK